MESIEDSTWMKFPRKSASAAFVLAIRSFPTLVVFCVYRKNLCAKIEQRPIQRKGCVLLCVGNIAFGSFSSTSKAVFYIKHNIRNVQDDKERLETKRNCIKRSEFTFENQLFPVVLPTSSFWWELVVVQLDRTTWKRGDAQNGCAVRKIADLVLELVLVVDANILYYDWRQPKTQLWRRLLNFTVRVFVKSAVKGILWERDVV